MKFKWMVEIEVDETWVADGFNLDRERLLEMVGSDLRHALPELEFDAKIIKFPDPAKIRKVQGYES